MKWKGLMPTYTFFNEQSGTEYDETMTIAEYDEFIEKNPHIKSRKDISKYASKTYTKSKKIEYKDYKYPFMEQE